MKLVVEAMELEDIPQVLDVDRESYSLPWPSSAYRREILHNRHARYVVLRRVDDNEHEETGESEPRPRVTLPFFHWPRGDSRAKPGHIVGYAGMWLMVDEAHITTIAVRNHWRGHGYGELLLASLIKTATEMGAERVTLEVRVTNGTAQNLYRKYGFEQEGVRPRYYSDNNEDAYIMTTGNVLTAQYHRRLDALVDLLHHRFRESSDTEIVAPAFGDARKPEPAQEPD